MEILTKQLEMNQLGRTIVNQFLVDEDYNVPDSKPDVRKVILAEGVLKIEEQKPMDNYLRLIGSITFQVLYETESMATSFSCLEGKLPFDEMIYIEEGANDNFTIKNSSVDLKINMIHSRKLRAKAIAELAVQAEIRKCEEIPVDVIGEKNTYKKQENLELLRLHTSKRDTWRIKEEITLPGTKESLGMILWSDISNRKLDTRLVAGEMQFTGELQVFCFYESPDEKIDWIEQSVPYSGKVECYGIDETMFHHVKAELEDVRSEIRVDEDGEFRVIGIEGTLKFSLAVYEEEEVQVIRDLYSLEGKCLLETSEAVYEQLLLQNHSKCKVMERLSVPELKNQVLQICHSKGRVLVEQMEPQADGVLVSGVLYVNFLYVKSSDDMPFDVWQGMVPFSHLVECGYVGEGLRFDISTMLEQLNVTLQGGNEIEVKAALAFHGFFRKEEKIQKINEIQLEPFSKEELEKRPSIVGYIVKEGDDIWSLAKRYYTSEKSIREMNELGDKEVRAGDRLLIFKENMGIL